MRKMLMTLTTVAIATLSFSVAFAEERAGSGDAGDEEQGRHNQSSLSGYH